MTDQTTGILITVVLFVVLALAVGRSIVMWWTGINDVKTQLKISNFLMIRSMSEEQLAKLSPKEKKSIGEALESNKF